MVGDYWKEQFPQKYPGVKEWIIPTSPVPTTLQDPNTIKIAALEKELAALKKDMEEFKKLLIAAKLYDDATDQHECEMDEKVELIKKVAELVGVDLKEVFG
jgi:hypothetical protein